MAKRKTPKTKEVVDLTAKSDKITTEQLEKLQGTVNSLSRAQMDLGVLESRKHELLHSVMAVQDQIKSLQAEFLKDYGTYDVNVKDGTINYTTDVEANKED